MRQLLLVSIVTLAPLAACGGKSTPKPVPADNEVAEPPPGDVGGETYGGIGYGGDAYGGMGYGGVAQPYVPPPPQRPNLVGTWASACAPTGKAKEHRKLAFVITDARWDLRIGSFGDAACAKRSSEIHVGGPYVIGEQSPTVATAWDGTFSFDVREVTADDKKSAKALAKLCKVKLKAKGTADLLAKGCPSLGMKPLADCGADHDVVAIDGDKLRFGTRPANNDMCAPEKRPTALETGLELSYQWQPLGIAECDAVMGMVGRFMACSMIPADQKGYAFEGFRQMEVSLRQGLSPTSPPEAVQATTDACKQASDAMSQGLQAMNC